MAQAIDFTAQPMPSGGLRSEELVLEKYTRETEKLAQQAPATQDLARNIRLISEEFRGMRVEVDRLGGSFREFTTTLRSEFGKLVGVLRGITGIGGRQQFGGLGGAVTSSVTPPSSVVTSAVIATVAAQTIQNVSQQKQFQLPTTVVTSAQEQRERVGRAVLTRKEEEAQQEALQTGGILAKINDPSTTAKDIEALGVKNVSEKRAEKAVEEREKKPFESPEDFVKRIGIGGPDTQRGKETIESILGKDVGKRKELTPFEKFRGNLQDETKRYEDKADFENKRKEFAGSEKGAEALRKHAKAQEELNRATRAANWQEQVALMGKQAAMYSFLSERANEYSRIVLQVNSAVAASAQSIFAFTTGLIASTGAVGSPVEWQTFKRSIEGVAASVGEAFGPALLQASKYLQDAADWFRNLDQGTKENIGSWVKWGVIVSGAIIVGSRFLPMILAVGRGLLYAGGALETYLVNSMKFSTVTSSILAGLGVTGLAVGAVALAWWGANRAIEAFRGNQQGVVNQARDQDRAQRLNQTIAAIRDPEARARIQQGGTPEETERRIQEYRQQLNQRIEAANQARLRGVGGQEAERRRMNQEFEQRMPQANEEMERVRRERQRIAAQVGAPWLENEAIRRAMAQNIAGIVFPGPTGPPNPANMERFQAQQAEAEAQRQRLIQRLTTGRDPGVGPSPRGAAAQAEHDRLIEERRRITELFGEGGPRLSLQGLLPSPQMFQDFSQLGEQLTLKSLERQGEQDVVLSLQRIEAIANAVGGNLEILVNNTDLSNFMRMIGGFTPSSGRP